MVEIKNYESFYSGGYSSLNSESSPYVGFRLPQNMFGSTTSIQTANQVNEVASRIREGVKNVEVSQVNPDTFDQIPKQQFEEIRALAKMSGVKASVHAPIIDPVGFHENRWLGEEAREDAERRFWSVIQKSKELDPDGNIPIVIHSTGGLPGTEFRPDKNIEPGEEGRFHEKRIIAFNKESKQLVPLEEETKFYPNKDLSKGGTLMDVESSLASANATEWENKLTNLATFQKHANEIIGDAPLMLGDFAKKELSESTLKELASSPEQAQAYSKLQQADVFLSNVRLNFNGLFDKAYSYGTEEQKQELKKLADEISKKQEEIQKNVLRPVESSHLYSEAIQKLGQITHAVKDKNSGEIYSGVPQVFVRAEDFAREKSAETFGNLAWKSYEEYKDKAPVLAIENMYQGMAFSRAEDLKELVEDSRKKFVENAKKQGMSESVAKKKAEEILGVTWDVGHLNMIKKSGFKDEDVVEQTKKIAKLVRHVHLTDNFGYSDSHLAPGMGNVPFKKILEQLEKTGRLDEMRAIIEAPTLVNPNLGLKMSPLKWTMGAFSSPIYGAKMAPYWNQVENMQGGYFGFPMAYLPEKHFSMYGSGFSMLPEELGGQVPGSRSRFSGAGMA